MLYTEMFDGGTCSAEYSRKGRGSEPGRALPGLSTMVRTILFEDLHEDRKSVRGPGNL